MNLTRLTVIVNGLNPHHQHLHHHHFVHLNKAKVRAQSHRLTRVLTQAGFIGTKVLWDKSIFRSRSNAEGGYISTTSAYRQTFPPWLMSTTCAVVDTSRPSLENLQFEDNRSAWCNWWLSVVSHSLLLHALTTTGVELVSHQKTYPGHN